MLAQYHNGSDTEMLMHSLFDRSVFLGALGILQKTDTQGRRHYPLWFISVITFSSK